MTADGHFLDAIKIRGSGKHDRSRRVWCRCDLVGELARCSIQKSSFCLLFRGIERTAFIDRSDSPSGRGLLFDAVSKAAVPRGPLEW